MQLGPARVDRAALQFARARGLVYRSIAEARELRHEDVELLHARLDAGTDVHREAATLLGRPRESVDDVIDVHEVAGLGTVAEDEWLLAVEQPLGEDRDDTRFTVRVLAGPVHVRQ